MSLHRIIINQRTTIRILIVQFALGSGFRAKQHRISIVLDIINSGLKFGCSEAECRLRRDTAVRRCSGRRSTERDIPRRRNGGSDRRFQDDEGVFGGESAFGFLGTRLSLQGGFAVAAAIRRTSGSVHEVR